MQADVADDTEHRIGFEAALRRRKAEQRPVVPYRQRHQRDRRQREVDREDRARDELVRAWHVSRRVPRLLGEVGDRLHPRVRDHRDRDPEEELAPGRRDAEVDVADQDVRVEDQRGPDQHEQELRREVEDGEDDVEPCRLPQPEDVQRDEDRDHRRAADDVPGRRP